ncbi:MAG: 3-hydroxyacyl-CoA dehydrogenase family protein [Bacillota bacterium]|jgi:3-hydroxybutyryl-CoA dehydrogenase|nr:3-hydroxyacyl-CoA dehydrogenase family protein [Bacillota bacterium]NLV64046.1 3-hydroxyacyl-CoA dehydrogenase family protein [Clostridiaceae bacterium]
MNRDAVVIAGSGMMGSGIAAVSALAGEKTIMLDVDADRAKSGIELAKEHIKERLDNGLTSQQQADCANDLLSYDCNLEEAMARATLVIEAVYEDLGLKQEIFEKIDSMLPKEIPIASNTSGLRITDISSRTIYTERTLTAHFWFPAHLVPLVEVVMGDKTDENVAIMVKERLTDWGKAPVLVRKDLPGQLANRILQAVIREAVNIVEMGLATPEDVDTAVKMGMGIRFPAWGPLEHVDGVGVDLCCSVQDSVLPVISSRHDASPLFRELVEKGELGYKTKKGFYDWTKKDMESLAKKRNEFIIHALKKLI